MWNRCGLKLRWLLFLPCILAAAVPVSILGMWTGQADMQAVIGMSGLSLAISGTISWWLAGKIAGPLETLSIAMRRIASGHLDTPIAPMSKLTPIELQDLEHDVHQVIEQLSQAQSSLRYAMAQAEHAHQSKAAFLSHISEELRTPLHGMAGLAELGMTKSTAHQEEKLHKYFERIYQSSKTLLMLLDALLDISSLETGNMIFEDERVDLHQLVSHIIETFTTAFSERCLALAYTPPSCPIYVSVEPLYILQVLVNLISNAVKFAPEGSTITIQLEQESHHAKLYIRNGDLDMPGEELESIFGEFAQLSLDNIGGCGDGLGLAICSEVVARYHGQIRGEETPSAGGVFFVYLPARLSVDNECFQKLQQTNKPGESNLTSNLTVSVPYYK